MELTRGLRPSPVVLGVRPFVGVLGSLPALVVLSAVLAALAARLPAPPGEALWNLDLPKIDAPLAVFFHEALVEGRLPLWNDRLGLGFPLYAEGQIGAFYPPNWLIYRLEPLAALDVARWLHLAIAGVGTGVLALRVAGSRTGAAVATAVAILGGAIVTKLEWTNLVAAYAWLPWILLPLARRPAPTRAGLVVAGLLYGLQALAGHPNTWLLTGAAAAVLLLATQPGIRAVGRAVVVGAIGAGVGAAQLLPTLLLQQHSVRSEGLSPDDLFTSSATVFDPLGFAFAQPFIRTDEDGWDFFTGWYPDGSFALLEASAFVGLGVLGLAAVGAGTRRARPWLVVGLVMLAIPIIAAFRPEPWLGVPVLNGLRSPVRSYLIVALVLGLLAAVGIGRLARSPAGTPGDAGIRRATVVMAAFTAWMAVVAVGAAYGWRLFEVLLRSAANRLDEANVLRLETAATAALVRPLPLLAEIALGFAVLAVMAIVVHRPTVPRVPARLVIAGLAILPLAVLSPLANPLRPVEEVWPRDSELAVALRAAAPNRVLTLDRPGFYDGQPDRLAAAGIADLEMFSSLDLAASTEVLELARHASERDAIRQLVGVDTLVTFGVPCPGSDSVQLEADQAVVCRVPALTGPYWIPADAVPRRAGVDVEIDVERALTGAVVVPTVTASATGVELVVDVPEDGYVWLDKAWWPSWSVRVDGQPVTPVRGLGGMLTPVTAGRHVVTARLEPTEAVIGAAIGLGVAIVAVLWALGRPGLRRTGGPISPSARRRS